MSFGKLKTEEGLNQGFIEQRLEELRHLYSKWCDEGGPDVLPRFEELREETIDYIEYLLGVLLGTTDGVLPEGEAISASLDEMKKTMEFFLKRSEMQLLYSDENVQRVAENDYNQILARIRALQEKFV